MFCKDNLFEPLELKHFLQTTTLFESKCKGIGGTVMHETFCNHSSSINSKLTDASGMPRNIPCADCDYKLIEISKGKNSHNDLVKRRSLLQQIIILCAEAR